MNISEFRTVGLALFTVFGAVHLSTAEATPLKADTCEDNARMYAQIYCHAHKHDDWSSVTYWCEGSTAHIVSVSCTGGPQEPNDQVGG